ncbi:serine/threonine-protein kinase CTR1-like isoform X3 [Malus sylvestris]|uniref:serine/threonine-protein kinase CTR1-like isoform X3 n=1 Tax=Malus sylvestris TaxID=3752 RepID=UPI0021AC9B6C|nr:serine/threonine-protein kinase CTR1-like isoform X3 [Malus sylvestris]
MEMPGRRSNYKLLSQVPDDQTAAFYETESKNKGKCDSGLDWVTGADYRANQQAIRAGNPYSSAWLQRQSSGFGYVPDDVFKVSGVGGEFRMKGVHGAVAITSGGGGSSSWKSWAQQTEESYQLQLALALRLSSEATCADDPNFLDPVLDESMSRTWGSVDAISHRFWVNGCLSYFDKVPDGFYLIHGIDQYVWTVCTDLKENGRIPSIDSLRSVDPGIGSSIEVVLIDRRSDPNLKELQNRVLTISRTCITMKEIVDQMAKLVCNRMGGSASVGEDEILSIWRESSDDLKDCGSVVVPIGSLSVGLCRHRALLFKVLADTIGLPCRIAKGCKCCTRDNASSCLVRFERDREYLVDLIANPGYLLLANQYFSDCQSLNLVFDEASAGSAVDEDNMYPKQFDRKSTEGKNLFSSFSGYTSAHAEIPETRGDDRNPQLFNRSQNIVHTPPMVNVPIPLTHMPPVGHRDGPKVDTITDSRFVEGVRLVPSKPSKELALNVGNLDIPWSDLVIKEKIGAGSFGTVQRADWHGSDVAVKILMEQDLHEEHFKEFLSEVTIMKDLRHPNIVLFMGAVTKPPNLSIVTEYLSRGSLFMLLQKPGAREALDENSRLKMAHDVAKGMNYLHRHKPPIVHHDLKSPNLLVDKHYTVKVCDFGLSRSKASTFLSPKSAAGTAEWMAPEVMRNEPSNEKSDVYSFGVILWELATLQRPWGNLNPLQVVSAVVVYNKRLDIPHDVNPRVAAIIEACWANEPWKRPSFASIMESLTPLIKDPVTQPSHANMPLLT